LIVGVDTSDMFQYLVDKAYQHTQSGIGKTLSMGGKEVKLKVVPQATPAYAMSVFLVQRKYVNESVVQYRIVGGVMM
jgi:hypothetical protein